MNNKIDYILLGVLWLLAATLGTSFWFNTRFGFNIFSGKHWNYLAQLQAQNTDVQSLFYISWIIAIFVTIFGLYLLVRPRLRRISLARPAPQNPTPNDVPKIQRPVAPRPRPTVMGDEKPKTDTKTDPVVPVQESTPPQTTAPVSTSVPAPKPAPAQSFGPRPPRLYHGASSTMPTLATPTAPISTVTPQATPMKNATPPQDNPEIYQIFTDAGYTVRKTPRIGRIKIAVLAMGTNETLWLGGIGLDTETIERARNELTQIFNDTLDSIHIGINAFTINAPDAGTDDNNDILMFPDIDALREYMAEHKNEPIADPDEQENFDAFSEYIDTVLNYAGKL